MVYIHFERSCVCKRGRCLMCWLQAHGRGGAFRRGLQADVDAGVVAVLVADVKGVVAVARRLPQGLRTVGLPQQLAVGKPGVGRHAAVGLQGEGLSPVFDDGAVGRGGDAQPGDGWCGNGVFAGLPRRLRRGVVARR